MAKLEAIAATLGSDLSFFFHSPSAVCRGRGEIVRPISAPRPSHGVLILPEFAMGTPGVYRRFDEMGLGVDDLDAESPNWFEWSGFDSQQLLPKLVNDLEAPAFSLEPKLGRLREDAQRRLKRIVRMSGSGSSLFTLYDDGKEANEASEKLNSELSNVHAISVELAPRLRDDLHENLGATKQ
jgi:4-diphosphocytidyl-2-C-methyl-D-erythritol kinase